MKTLIKKSDFLGFSTYAIALGLTWVAVACSGKGNFSDTTSSSYVPYSYTAPNAYISHFSDLIDSGNLANADIQGVSFSYDIPKAELIQCLLHKKLENIEKLDLSNTTTLSRGEQGAGSLSAEDLANTLPRFKNLKELNLASHGHVNDDILQHVAKLPHLTHLNVSKSVRITDAGIAHLSAASKIVQLNIKSCSRITDASLVSIANLHQLTELDANDIRNISDQGVAHLSQLKNMTKLALGGSKNITLECIESFTELGHLSDLALEEIDLSPELEHKVRILAKLPILNKVASRLTHLSLKSDGQILDDHLEMLTQKLDLNQLTYLNLEGTGPITNKGLNELRSLRHLEKLKISTHYSAHRLITRIGLEQLLSSAPQLDASLLFPYEAWKTQ